jgi:hypothetical protein
VRVRDSSGQLLDAEYAVEAESAGLALIMQSRNGKYGKQPPRNPDYNQALTILLERLGSIHAILVDAFVDSQRTRGLGLAETERRIIDRPVELWQEPDMNALRRTMGRAQRTVAQAPGATQGGNSTKRIRLRLQVPGYQSRDAQRLAVRLSSSDSGVVPTFILTWHPGRYAWEQHGYAEAIRLTTAGQNWDQNWSVGLRKRGISPGDRALLYRQHDQRGLVASGTFTSGVEIRHHWDGSGHPAPFADIDWDTVLGYRDRLPVEQLRAEIPEVPWDHLQGSGVQVPADATGKLAGIWQHHIIQALYHSQTDPGSPDASQPPRTRSPRPTTDQPGELDLGGKYFPAQPASPDVMRPLVTIDLALYERGLRGHADTQNKLAAFLRGAGIDPRSPLSPEPSYDLAWERNGTIFVAEIKSITDDNEEQQLRLGLGQVLRYRHRLQELGYPRVTAVLVPEHTPHDPTWISLCQQLGVILVAADGLDAESFAEIVLGIL